MNWGKRRRRQRLRERPFPVEWQRSLDASVPLYRRLPPSTRDELHGHVQVLLAEKRFEAAGGLELSDAVKLTILSQAALLLLGRPTDYFPKLVSILIYPGEYEVQEEMEHDDGLVSEIRESRAGESWTLGTLILSWEDVQADLADPESWTNVVLHEFAHQLDAETGDMNGAPVLSDPDLRRRWAAALGEAYERLTEAVDRDEDTLLDPYGAEDPSEFFAVVTETFFLHPRELEQEEPGVYAVLRDVFRQDPARWTA